MLCCLNNENCYLKNITKHVPNLPHHKTIEHEQQFPHFVYKCRLNQSTGIFLFENSSKKNLHFRGIFTHQWILQITNSRLLEEATDWFTQCFFFLFGKRFNQCCTLSMLDIHIVRTTDSRFTMLCSYPNEFFQGYQISIKPIFKLLSMSSGIVKPTQQAYMPLSPWIKVSCIRHFDMTSDKNPSINSVATASKNHTFFNIKTIL